MPERVSDATARYFDDQDLLEQWLRRDCVVDLANPRLRASAAVLFGSWSAFAHDVGEPFGTARRLGELLRKRGIRPRRSSSARGFVGIALKGATDNAGSEL